VTLAIRELEAFERSPGAVEVDRLRGAPSSRSSRASTTRPRGEAESVHLQHWLYGLPSSRTTRLRDTDLWYFLQELPPRSRMEYKLEIQRSGEPRGRLVLDPLNPHLAHDPFGANSVCHGRSTSAPDAA
jgi:enterochelin esterase family protein